MADPKKGYLPGVYRLVEGTVDGSGDFSITNVPKEGWVPGIYQLTEVTVDDNGDTTPAWGPGTEDSIGIAKSIAVTVDANGDLSETGTPQEGYNPGCYRVTTSTNIPKEGFMPVKWSAVIGSISNGIWEAISIIFNAPLTNSLIPSAAVDGTYTFSRVSDATVTDFEGLVKTCVSGEARFPGARRVENLVPTNSDGAGFFATGGTYDTGTSEFIVTGQFASLIPTGPNRPNAVIGRVYRVSIDFEITTGGQGGAGTNWRFNEQGTATFDKLFVNFNYRQGSVRNTLTGLYTCTGSGTMYWSFQYMLAVDFPTYTLHGYQIEDVTGQLNQNPGEIISVGKSEDHGSNADGVKYFPYENGRTVVSGVVNDSPGPDIPAATLKGVLVEEARTNYCLYSEDLSNAAWVASNITKSSDGVDLPNGKPGTAETLTASAANGTLLQTITLANNADTFSVYLQRKTGTGNIDITLDNGLNWTTKALTGVGTWDRVDIQGTTTNPVVGVRIVTSGDAIQMWGAQLEVGAYPTTLIHTTASITVRNNETLNYPLTNVDEAQGTVALTFSPHGSTAEYQARAVNAPVFGVRNSGTDVLYIDATSGEFVLSDGTNNTNTTAMPSLVRGTAVKLAARWAGTSMDIGQDTTEANATFDGSMNESGSMTVGYSFVTIACGSIKNLLVYNDSVDDATFTSLTT